MDQGYDLLIIGAGPSGLCAAKTFLECEPNARIALIDANRDVGGVWASRHLYPGLKTNNVWSMVDYTDFPMDKSFGVRPGEHVSGEAMHDYLVAYAQKWDIMRRIKFNTKVSTIERDDSGTGWKLTVQRSDSDAMESGESALVTKKLIVATGVTNEPHRPRLPGQETFGGQVLHSADLGEEKAWRHDPNVKTVAVLGGGKSAYDAVYLAVTAGKEVEWIIRKSGKGPTWIFPARAALGPFKALREKLVLRRFVSCFSPYLWSSRDCFGWIRFLLHSTAIGRFITQHFWDHLRDATLEECRYREDKSFNLLEPEQSPFWYGTASGTFNYETDFFQSIKSGQIRIHREDISHLSPQTIHLATDPPSTLTVSTMITATGYTVRPTVQFLPASLTADLGLPVPRASLTPTQHTLWTHLESEADQTISRHFPRLTAGPFTSPSSRVAQPFHPGLDTPNSDLHVTPYRLYRGIAPPFLTLAGDRSLAFIGYAGNIANTIRLEVQCLWAYAYLTSFNSTTTTTIAGGGNKAGIKIQPSEILPQTALLSRFSRHRAPYGHGQWYHDVNFDQLSFIDVMMRDLGLPVYRKDHWSLLGLGWCSPWRWLREFFEPYSQKEYRGVVREWMEVQRKKKI